MSAAARRSRKRGGAPMTQPDLLVAEGITKRFGGVQALSEVSFTIREGRSTGSSGRTAPARRRYSTC